MAFAGSGRKALGSNWHISTAVLCILTGLVVFALYHEKDCRAVDLRITQGTEGAGELGTAGSPQQQQQQHGQAPELTHPEQATEGQPDGKQQQEEQQQQQHDQQQQEQQDQQQPHQQQDQQQQQQQQGQQQQGQQETAPEGAPRLRWFRPEGYTLPPECVAHEDLYVGIFQNLRPWFARGITQKDMDACAPIATPDMNTTMGTPNGWHFRLLMWENKAVITSGGLKRLEGIMGLEYFMIKQIQDAAQRFSLPNIEFAVGFGDLSRIKQPEKDGSLCPLLTYCKIDPEDYDLVIPDGHFIQNDFDGWLEKNRGGLMGPPWEEREEKVVGRFSAYDADAPHTQLRRDRQWSWNPRKDYGNYSDFTHGEFSNVSIHIREFLEHQMRYKYTLHLDGIGCSTRLQKLLAGGQVVLRQDSMLREFFEYALQPWVHYVPVGWNGVEEMDWAVQFLRRNDALARSIADNGKRFALEHLGEEGRLCYIKVLFEEVAKLMRYTPKLDDFPVTISYDDELQQYDVLSKIPSEPIQ